MTPQEAIGRWDGFLGKIKERAASILAEAEEGCAMLLDLNNLDPLPMSNAWSAIEQQLIQLTSKIDDTWNEKVEPAFDEADWDWDQIGPQHAKGESLNAWVERQKDDVGIRIFSAAAEKVFAEAKEHLAREYKCSQCMAALPVSDRFFRSAHITCNYCQNVNTFVPSSKVASVEHFCCHHLSRARTRDLWFAWLSAEERMRDTNHENLGVMKDAEQALKTYTEAFLRARIGIVPEYEKDFEKDLEGRMRSFYEDMSRNEAWTA